MIIPEYLYRSAETVRKCSSDQYFMPVRFHIGHITFATAFLTFYFFSKWRKIVISFPPLTTLAALPSLLGFHLVLFELLPSGRRFRSAKTHTSSFRDSFSPKAVLTFNLLSLLLLTTVHLTALCQTSTNYLDSMSVFVLLSFTAASTE